jgi:PAS domain S-box-containing protein
VNPPGILDRLVGDGARVAIGNLAGGVWTDFSRVIQAPPVDLAHRGVRQHGSAADGQYLGAVTPIPNTSWAAWVEFPESSILAPAQRVLNRMVGLALIFLIVGVGLVSTVPIGMTRPLRQLSAVAARIGNGDYSGRIVTNRSDEIGRLAEAFNGMTSEIARAYGALKRSDDRKEFALGAAHMGIWDVDVATDQVTWSDSMARIFGRQPDQAPRTIEEFYEVVHPEDRQLVRDAISLATGEHQEEFFVEYRSTMPDGSVRWIEETARVLYGEDGSAASLLGVAMDVTGRKTLETQLRQGQKMEAIGQLAGGIAHDFNNLLTAILGYARLLADTLAADDVRRRDVHEIHDAAERAAGLTRQLLAFSRQQMLQPTPVNLNELVVDTSQLLRRLIGEHINLVTSLNPDLAPVLADKTQLEQVIINLAVNARDAMPGGGTLSISTANADLDETYATHHLVMLRPGPYVMLAVSDTGVGMNDTTRRRLFEPFFTTKERGKGTGLGLATVYGIVKQSGGYVWVYSEPGRGAAFKVYLPRAEQHAEKAAVTREPSLRPAGGSETVLVVEDEAAVRFLTRLILERAGYCVLDAPNPEAAAELCTDDVVLLLSDVIMPGATGPTLYKLLAQRHPRLKVLYMSGYTDDMVTHEGMLDPETAFLQKPFSNDGLLRKVRDVLDR